MSHDTAATLPPRRKAAAFLLSLLGAGIGHLYAGRGLRGALLLGSSFAWAPATVALSHAEPSMAVLYTLVAVCLGTVCITLYALVDSVFAARRATRPYAARPYNHIGLYLGLAALNALWFIGAAHLVRDRAFKAYVIPTQSMMPGVESNDRILVNMRARTPLRGDLIVFPAPGKHQRTFFKRVVGLPGETIEFKEGLVYVDGRALPNERVGDEEYEERAGERTYRIKRDARGTRAPEGRGQVVIPAGHVFVLGDNRSNAFDSRRFGTLPLSSVGGTAQYTFYPASRAGLLR